MELTEQQLGVCETAQHHLVPIGEPHQKDGVLTRIVLKTFCQRCGNTYDLVLHEVPLQAIPTPPIKA